MERNFFRYKEERLDNFNAELAGLGLFLQKIKNGAVLLITGVIFFFNAMTFDIGGMIGALIFPYAIFMCERISREFYMKLPGNKVIRLKEKIKGMVEENPMGLTLFDEKLTILGLAEEYKKSFYWDKTEGFISKEIYYKDIVKVTEDFFEYIECGEKKKIYYNLYFLGEDKIKETLIRKVKCVKDDLDVKLEKNESIIIMFFGLIILQWIF